MPVQMFEKVLDISNRVLLFLLSSLSTGRLRILLPGTAMVKTEATTLPRFAAPEP
jgi:hypothetical protein